MIPIFLLLLLISPAWSLAQETEELSLVEAARRERERRASITEEVKILTNRDIEEMEGFVSTATASEPVAEASEEVESEEMSLELSFEKARDDLQSAENRDRLLQLQMKYLRDQWLGNSDGVTQQKIQSQLQETQQELEISRQEVEAARAAYQALQNKAKADGILPGELRLLMGKDS
jgi:flagellar biosynthesis GTPase FlhF